MVRYTFTHIICKYHIYIHTSLFTAINIITHIYTLTYLQIMYISNIYIRIERKRYTYMHLYPLLYAYTNLTSARYTMLWPILPYTTPTHPIYTKYEITHIHPNMTFQIIPIVYTTYIHTYHTYTIVNNWNKEKNLPFHPKIFQNVKGRNNIIVELQILITLLQNECNSIIIIMDIFKLS